jgi:hypothetical protein
MTDKKSMTSSVSMDSSLAVLAATSSNRAIMSEISMAIMKQVQDQQKVIGEALVEMIKQTPMPDGTGQIINRAA